MTKPAKKPPEKELLLVKTPDGFLHLSYWRPAYSIFSCQSKGDFVYDWKYAILNKTTSTFSVHQDGKPARLNHDPWKNNEFSTWNEALEYAKKWAGHCWIEKNPEPNKPFRIATSGNPNHPDSLMEIKCE